VRISTLLYQLLHEVLSKGRFQSTEVEALWRVIQPRDPEYSSCRLLPIPREILPLVVEEKEKWLSDHSDAERVTIEDTLPQEWVTAFEFRQLTQDNPYHREYVMQTHVQSALLRPESIEQIVDVGSQSWGEEVVTHHPAENLTWSQFRNALANGHKLEGAIDEPCIPLVARKGRRIGFMGFHTIASFSSRIIREFALSLNGFDVIEGSERVGRFEAWQEGYSDEDYVDEPLSFGVRFQVRATFLRKICDNWGRALAVRNVENRFVMKDNKQEPVEQRSRTAISIWPLPLQVEGDE
jgi:hypothetical protein